MRAMLFLLTVFSGIAKGESYLDLDRFSMKLMRFNCNREMMTPQIDCFSYRDRVSADFDINILNYGFWRNQIHGEGTEAKFMTVGWHFEMGVKFDQFELFHEHHSRHTLDQAQPMFYDEKTDSLKSYHFPVEDSIGIRIIFYEKAKR
jgi:hypothetical protein